MIWTSRETPGRLSCLAAIVVSLSLSGFGQAKSDPWLIVLNGAEGAINAHTTRADLVNVYGAPNVVDREVDIGEGEMQSATLLFPNDPKRQLEILWKDPDTKTQPQSADIFLVKKSFWHTVYGVTIGTPVIELERLNGRRFHFALTNDGTDMAEETISWQGGRLEKEFQGRGRVILEIEDSPARAARQRGPHDFEANSDSPAWRAEKPHISRITWIFPGNAQP
jgi:hypothetical protein